MSLGCGFTAEDVTALAARAAFGRPLVTNVHRGLLVEAMIALALAPDWEWCATDYAAWDFQRADGLKLELKQSASRQSWHRPGDRSSPASFDIRAREGRYDGPQWIAEHRRWADVYVFAHHAGIDDQADHRDPEQWLFYVLPERRLPKQHSLSLSRIAALAAPAPLSQLKDTLATLDRAAT